MTRVFKNVTANIFGRQYYDLFVLIFLYLEVISLTEAGTLKTRDEEIIHLEVLPPVSEEVHFYNRFTSTYFREMQRWTKLGFL